MSLQDEEERRGKLGDFNLRTDVKDVDVPSHGSENNTKENDRSTTRYRRQTKHIQTYALKWDKPRHRKWESAQSQKLIKAYGSVIIDSQYYPNTSSPQTGKGSWYLINDIRILYYVIVKGRYKK